MIKMLFCDIDGTLITTRFTGDPKNNRFYYSVKEVFGVNAAYDRKKFNGWTDYQILLEMIKPFGIRKSELDRKLDTVAECMLKRFEKISGGINYFPIISGVNEFLESIDKLPLYKGVFTGNLSKVGKWKLCTNHIDKFFTFALFGDYTKNKTELLGKELVPLLHSMKVKIKYEDCCVVGDTLEDIKAGKNMRLKTIGVLTSGYTTRQEMESVNPDLLVNSLQDQQVMQFIHT